jgi:hypothetical protein
MKLLKKLLLIFLLLLITGSIGGYFFFKNSFKAPPNQLAINSTGSNIPFRWQADTINHVCDPYAALLLPVKVAGCERVFYMQFDLGAPYSLLYRNKVKAINQQFNNMREQQHDKTYKLMNCSFQVGTMPVTARQIKLLERKDSSGINWNDSTAIDVIGTLGADLIEHKVLIINYPGQWIFIGEKIPDSIATYTPLTPFVFKERRVLLPAVINNKKTELFFDTGSSAYELLTDQATFNELSKPGAPVEKYNVNSWDDTLTVYNKTAASTVSMAGAVLPLHQVTWMEGMSFIQRLLMRFSGMGGMTGNKLFINKTLVLDAKHQQFGIMRQ